MRLKEFATILEYRRDVTANKMGAQLIAAAKKDRFFAAGVDIRDGARATDIILSKLEAMDPTRNQQYVTWLARQYIAGQFKMEDLAQVKKTLADYTKLKPRLNSDRRDINRLDYHSVVSMVEDILNPEVGLDTDAGDTFPVIKDAQVLYNGPLGQLAQPQTEAASCELGSGTKWCTAATESENMYEHYIENGVLTVWRDRNGQKYQFFIPNPGSKQEYEFTDSRNRAIPDAQLEEFRQHHPVLRQWFRQVEQQIMRSPEAIERYAREALKRRWPEAEPQLLESPVVAVTYAKWVIQGRWPEAESSISEDPAAAVKYAETVIEGRWPEAESSIIKDAQAAAHYARYVLRGRWKQAESEIIKDAKAAMEYSAAVLRRRWPEAEDVIAQDPWAASQYAYASMRGRRWPEAEDVIAQDARAAAYYAQFVIEGRWPEAESTIIQHPQAATNYAMYALHRPWRAAESTIAQDPESLARYNHWLDTYWNQR